MTIEVNTNVHKRPEVLECDVVRFQNAKDKWVAFVGLLDGKPYEIFTGLQDDEEGIMLPKAVNSGKIIKTVLPDGTKRYDFQFENRRGYKTTVEGLSEQFNPIYWNYAKLPAGTLSGAPKIRACEIIDELEPERRGIYGGGMGYLDFGGNMDICITIRTMVKKNDRDRKSVV